jgi:hypothetical protein
MPISLLLVQPCKHLVFSTKALLDSFQPNYVLVNEMAEDTKNEAMKYIYIFIW